MKKISLIFECVGFTIMMIGGASMDNPSIILPLIMTFGGLGILSIGWWIDEEYAS